MFEKDLEVWERFLDQFGDDYENIEYDVKCGEPCKVPPHWQENYRKDAEVLSRLRIDAVGHKKDSIEIIEVKPRINQTAVGQIMVYKDLYKKDYKPTKRVDSLVVFAEPNPNIEGFLEKKGIKFIQV